MNKTDLLLDVRNESPVSSFALRRENNRDSLEKDVDAILRSLPTDTLIYHHVRQFSFFWPKMYECLIQAYDRLPEAGKNATDRETYLALAIGVLAAQWSILRAVAFQRMPGSPYLEGLNKLDLKTQFLYERLLQALPIVNRPIWQRLSSSYPLVYIGDVANLRLFGNAPAVVSVTFGALYRDPLALMSSLDYSQNHKMMNGNRIEYDRSALAISHELGHIVCGRMPDLLEHLEQQLRSTLGQKLKIGLHRKQAIMLNITLAWLEEIIADLFGVALEGPQFVKSALLNGALPDGSFTRGDSDHPPSIIRQWIQLSLLRYLAASNATYNSLYGSEIAELEQELEQANGVLDGRFELVPAATAVSLREMRDLALLLVEELLKTKPGAPKRRSVGEVFLTCATTAPKEVAVAPRAPWGEQALKESCNDPVLEFLSIEFDDPGTVCNLLNAIGIKCG